MKKSTLNFIIDALMFVCLCAITGIGLLIKFTLPSGQDKWAIYGTNNELLFLNMDRHQWGDIHFVVSVIMISLLILHLVFHWQFIASIFGKIIKHSPLKLLIGTSFAFITILLIVFPFFVTPSQGLNHKHLQHSDNWQNTELTDEHKVIIKTETTAHKNADNPSHSEHNHQYAVNGQMTLAEVCKKYNLPISVIKKQLRMENADENERLGRMRKQYAFRMSDIEKLITEYHQKTLTTK